MIEKESTSQEGDEREGASEGMIEKESTSQEGDERERQRE